MRHTRLHTTRKMLTALSFFGLVAAVGLWGMSYWNASYAIGEMMFKLEAGSVTVNDHEIGLIEYLLADPRAEPDRPALEAFIAKKKWNWNGFSRSSGFDTNWQIHINTQPGSLNVVLPLWMPTIAFSILPAASIARQLRRRRRLGRCVECGYSLKDLAEPRCPECAMPFERSDQSVNHRLGVAKTHPH